MQNLRLIKNRIRSAKNISQITKAMELVSASKMKKAQGAAEAGRLYAEKIREMVMQLGSRVDISAHPLLKKPKQITGKRLVIVISTNKGLCGGLNSSLFRFLHHQFPSFSEHQWVTIGQKGALFVGSMRGRILADFSSHVSFLTVVPAVTSLLIEQFLSGAVEGVDVVYNQFVSVLKQEPRIKSILPLTIEGSPAADKLLNFVIEPDPEQIFETLLPHYLENQVRDALLQAEASEHAARMVAMRNATDNAKAFISELTLVYNKARQEKITNEIADLVTARAAIVSE